MEQGIKGGKENIQTEMKNSLISPHPKGWWRLRDKGRKQGKGNITEIKYLEYGFIPQSFAIVHCLVRLSSLAFQVLFHVSSSKQKVLLHYEATYSGRGTCYWLFKYSMLILQAHTSWIWPMNRFHCCHYATWSGFPFSNSKINTLVFLISFPSWIDNI
jgi:hypothetical protein